jgi:hypothetical protein
MHWYQSVINQSINQKALHKWSLADNFERHDE